MGPVNEVPVAMAKVPELSHVPPEYEPEAFTFTWPLLVKVPVIVRAPPTPLSTSTVPALWLVKV